MQSKKKQIIYFKRSPTSGLQLSGVSFLFVCQFWASRDTGGNWGSSCRGRLSFSFVNSGPQGILGATGAPAVGGVCPFRLSIPDIEGDWASICQWYLFFSSVLCLSSLSVFLTIFIICHSSVILVCLICHSSVIFVRQEEDRRRGRRKEGRILI